MAANRKELLSIAEQALQEGDEATAQEAMDMVESMQTAPAQEETGQEEGNWFSGGVEAARATVQNSIAEPAAGLWGLGNFAVNLLDPNAAKIGVDAIDEARETLSFKPKTKTGQRYTDNVAGVVEPIGRALEWAGNDLGDVAMDVTGNPAIAGLSKALPTAAAAAIGYRTPKPVLQPPSLTPKKPKRIDPRIEPIRSGSGDVQTAKVKLNEKGAVVKDPIGKEAVRQGAEEGVVAAMKVANRQSKDNMLKMLDVLERGEANATYRTLNRPAQIMGDSIAARVAHVSKTKNSAGAELEGIAKSLKGQTVDYSPAVDNFIASMNRMEVKFNNGKLDFAGSDIEKIKGPQRVLKNITDRMLNTRTPDAYDGHRLKKFIDEQVSYGKSKSGLGGKTEGILKQLRRDIDEALDSKFPEYDRVNTQYSETTTALDEFQKSAGSSINMLGPNADKALGNEMRKLLSNYRSRTNLLDSLDEIDAIASKYGGKFNDDVIVQAMFAKELDNIFGAVAKGSFQGEIESGVKTALREGPTSAAKNAAMDVAAKKINDLRGVNKKAAIKALRDLLREQHVRIK